jgi:hypothetical protein
MDLPGLSAAVELELEVTVPRELSVSVLAITSLSFDVPFTCETPSLIVELAPSFERCGLGGTMNSTGAGTGADIWFTRIEYD